MRLTRTDHPPPAAVSEQYHSALWSDVSEQYHSVRCALWSDVSEQYHTAACEHPSPVRVIAAPDRTSVSAQRRGGGGGGDLPDAVRWPSIALSHTGDRTCPASVTGADYPRAFCSGPAVRLRWTTSDGWSDGPSDGLMIGPTVRLRV